MSFKYQVSSFKFRNARPAFDVSNFSIPNLKLETWNLKLKETSNG